MFSGNLRLYLSWFVPYRLTLREWNEIRRRFTQFIDNKISFSLEINVVRKGSSRRARILGPDAVSHKFSIISSFFLPSPRGDASSPGQNSLRRAPRERRRNERGPISPPHPVHDGPKGPAFGGWTGWRGDGERANRRKPRERGEPDPHTVTRERRPEGRVTVRGVRREVKPTGMTRDEESREVEPTSLLHYAP